MGDFNKSHPCTVLTFHTKFLRFFFFLHLRDVNIGRGFVASFPRVHRGSPNLQQIQRLVNLQL